MTKFSCIVVDDESFNIRFISDHISKCNELILLKTFSNPLNAKFFLDEEESIDILFTDVDMPHLNGISLAECMQSKVSHIVFITSHFKSDLTPQLGKPWYYLAKPASLNSFKQTLNEILDQNH